MPKKRAIGQITVNENRGTLRLRFPDNFLREIQEKYGKKWPRYKSLHFPQTDPITGESNWRKAEAIARAIYLDWQHPESDRLLDLTLAKYLGKPTDFSLRGQLPVVAKAKSDLFLKDIWEDYLEYHLVGKKHTTQVAYKQYGKKLEPWYDQPINKETARSIRQNFIEESTQPAKYAIAALANAVNWAIAEEKFKGVNPFNGIAQEITVEKRVDKVTNLPFEYVAFDNLEVKLILSGFQEKFPHYHNFFRFKFLTGCRTGEAIALTWEDIKFNENVVFFNKTYSGRSLSFGTKGKRGRTRQFPINNTLREWLLSLQKTATTELVFPNTKGKFLDVATLSRAWGQLPTNSRKTGVVAKLAYFL
ncbi:MAG: tyrosine-type recombinase/integrase [Okeania sp. SIO2H7]|nr:tyrosine-type recombinase/integrase [Okeania sp. SIO2H7]